MAEEIAAEKMSFVPAFVALAGLCAATWYFVGGGAEQQAAKTVATVQQSVASEFLQQYEIVKRHGSPTDRCMHANMVAGSYLGAKDEANYAKWRGVAKSDCKAAGIPLD